MIKQEFKLDKYNWYITVFYAVHGYFVEDIMEYLYELGINSETANSAFDLLNSDKLNTGLTFAKNNKAVCVIGMADNASQYMNSIVHEIMHLAVFISRSEGIPLDSEEACYIGGEIAQKMHTKTKLLTSECGCYTKRIDKKL